MRHKKTRLIAHAAMIAAIYVILTWLFAPFGFGEVQIRTRKHLLSCRPSHRLRCRAFIGCLIGNILSGAILPDIIFGSLATLIGAVLVYRMRNCNPLLLPIAPVLSNTVIVPLILYYGYGVHLPIPV